MGKSNSDGWGMGLLLVFFPDEEHNTATNKKQCEMRKSSSSSNNNNNNNNNSQGKWSYASPFGSSTTTTTGSSSSSLIHSKAQSTLSICVFIVFFTLFLFTLSTFDRTVPPKIDFPRRLLSDKKQSPPTTTTTTPPTTTYALQGLGTQYRRGTRAMTDLVVAHITEDTKPHHLKLFLRTLHRSGLTSRADVLFIFPNSQSPNFTATIHQENLSFSTLIHQTHHHIKKNDSTKTHKILSNFEATHFVTKNKNGGAESIWGTKQQQQKIGNSNATASVSESTRLSWGSVVGFESAELDPENSLSGFTDGGDPPMRLRRWACYPMLLGRIRRNFKHVLLADVKEVVLLGDPLARVRTRSPESVSVWPALDHSTTTHNNNNNYNNNNNSNSNKNRSHGKRRGDASRSVTADVIAGGMRGIRRLSGAVVNEIVRSAVKERRGKGGVRVRVSDSAVLSQLVRNESLLKSVSVAVTESAPSYDSVRAVSGGSVGVGDVILKQICGATRDASSVYNDC